MILIQRPRVFFAQLETIFLSANLARAVRSRVLLGQLILIASHRPRAWLALVGRIRLQAFLGRVSSVQQVRLTTIVIQARRV